MEEVAGAGSRLTMDGYGNNGVCSVSEILRDVGIGKWYVLSTKGDMEGGIWYMQCARYWSRRKIQDTAGKQYELYQRKTFLPCLVNSVNPNLIHPVHTSPRIFLSRQVLFRYTPIKKSWFGG